MSKRSAPPVDHPDFGNNRPADPSVGPLAAQLPNLQGNILKGHGRDHTVHVFFNWPAAANVRVQAFIKALASSPAVGSVVPFPNNQQTLPLSPVRVTSAKQQHDETDLYNRFGVPGATFVNFFLTAAGYRALGFTQPHLDAFFPESGVPYFKGGMKNHLGDLLDPPPAGAWDDGYTEDVFAMLLLADDDRGTLLREARALISTLQNDGANILQVERGDALRNKDEQTIEHFGYVDGRSQPLFLVTDFAIDGQNNVVEKDAVKGGGRIKSWNPVEPTSLVLVPDLAAGQVADCMGSYLVFRKLEQDVMRFKIREQELADALGLSPDERERAGAMAVGRFEDGTPVALSQSDGFAPARENDFTYAADANGLKCPFHAHIRKTNPRGDTARRLSNPPPAPDDAQANTPAERSRRIARRAITYGDRPVKPGELPSLSDLPSEGVGLLFMCFQASIAGQFAFMQTAWANNEAFVNPASPLPQPPAGTAPTGVDPVIGNVASPLPAPPGHTTAAKQAWINEWNDTSATPKATAFSFAQFVKLKGGEFFFAPSIPFLRSLAVPPLPPPPVQPTPPVQPPGPYSQT